MSCFGVHRPLASFCLLERIVGAGASQAFQAAMQELFVGSYLDAGHKMSEFVGKVGLTLLTDGQVGLRGALCVARSLPATARDRGPSSAQNEDPIIAKIGWVEPTHHAPFSRESFEVAAAFRPEASDVIITTPPKTGTTLLQQ